VKKGSAQTPLRKDSKAVAPISKEMRQKLDAFHKGIGQAMVDNLNRNVMKESEADDNAAKK